MTANSGAPKIIVVAGPTASGKSNYAVTLALDLGAEIVNIDSVQIYSGMDIGSAKMSAHEMRGVPHHLISVRAPNDPIDVARYIEMARQSIEEIHSRGVRVILCGGSGLYITSLLHGIAPLASGDRAVRRELDQLSNDELFQRLLLLDKESAQRLHFNDRRRVTRAIEAATVQGEAPSKILSKHAYGAPHYDARVLILRLDRERLYARINSRVDSMLEQGLIQEVRDLLERYGAVRPLDSLGYSQTIEFLSGSLGRDQLAEQISMHTRRFAKRQSTFWRNEPTKRGWIQEGTWEEPLMISPEKICSDLRAWMETGEPTPGNAEVRVTYLDIPGAGAPEISG